MPTFKHPCPACGKYIARDVARCPFCGAIDPFAPGRCPTCRAPIDDPAWVACPKCGAPLKAGVAEMPGGTSAAPTTPTRGKASPAAPPAPGAATPDAAAPPTAATPPVAVTPAAPGGPPACAACGSTLAPGTRFCLTCGSLVG